MCETIGSHLLNYGRRISLEEWDSRISVGICLFSLGVLSTLGTAVFLALVCLSNAGLTSSLGMLYVSSQGTSRSTLEYWQRLSVSCDLVSKSTPSQQEDIQLC